MTLSFKADSNIAKDNATQIINATYNHSAQTSIGTCLRKSDWLNPDFIKTDITAIDGILDESIEWIFRDDCFKRWNGEQQTTLLWIVGGAGKGKSTMTAGIVNELKKPSPISATSNTRPTVGYFFCRSSRDNANTAVDILKGLIYSLMNNSAQLGQYLYRHWNEHEQSFDSSVDRLVSLWQILRNMLNHPDQSPTYTIIDGLDECDGTIDELLHLIGTDGLTMSRPVKWLLSSRPLEPHLQHFSFKGPRQYQIVLDEHSSEMKDAIRRYVAVKVKQTALFDYNEVELGEIQSLLVNKAEESFLWVSLVCREITNLPAKKAVNIISTVPKRLFALYDRGMQKIRDGCQKGEEQSLRCWKLIWTRYSLHNDPHIVELSKLAGLYDDKNHGESYLRGLVNACNGFLLLTDNKTVRLVHTSAKDYLDHSCTQSSFLSIGIPNHQLITERCLGVLYRKLCKNISQLDWVNFAAADVKAAVKEDVRSRIGYSCTHWAKHLRIAGISPTLSKVLQHFLSTHFLHWIEALCVLDRLFDCMLDLETIISLLKSSERLELLKFVIEARTFVQLNGSRLARWPLQIYSSLLVFSPQQDFVAGYLAAQRPPWVTRCFKHNMPSILPLWTIETDAERIFNMVYSPSGRIIVTQSANALRLWRPEESSEFVVLLGETEWLRKSSTEHWRFLEDETKTEATLFDEHDSSLYWTATWDTVTGDLLDKKTEHRHRRRRDHRQEYSEDLQLVASCDSRGSEMLLEDMAGKITPMRFPAEPAQMRAWLTFSPNNQYLAACYDGSMHIWSTTGRRHLATINVGSREDWDLPLFSYFLKFSSDSKRLITFVYNTLGMFIWKHDVSKVLSLDGSIFDYTSNESTFPFPETGCMLAVHPSETDTRTCVFRGTILSPDGAYVAGIIGNGIFIAETETGIVIRRILGRFEAIAFKPEPLRLASSDSLGTIQVWAVHTDGHHPLSQIAELNTLPMLTSIEKKAFSMSHMESGSLGWINPDTKYEFIVPSPDSRFVCLNSYRWGIHLLDRLSDESFVIRSSPIDIGDRECIFSPDSQWFATSSKGNEDETSRIQVWSTSIARPSRSTLHTNVSWKHRHVFSGVRGSTVQAMSFSRDSSLLYCSYATTTGLFPRIWMDVLNLQNEQLRTIKGPLCTHEYSHDRGVACVSSDNSLVASTLGQKAGMVNVVILRDSGSRPCVLSTEPSPLAVKAMLFSPSGDLLAVHREEGKLEVYSTSSLTNGLLSNVGAKRTNPVAQFDGLKTLAHLEFTHDGQQIRTNCGTIHIKDHHISRSPDSFLQRLSLDEQWIFLGGQKILWLPPEYRPQKKTHKGRNSRTYFISNWIWFLDSTDCITAIEFDLNLVKELIREERFV